MDAIAFHKSMAHDQILEDDGDVMFCCYPPHATGFTCRFILVAASIAPHKYCVNTRVFSNALLQMVYMDSGEH